MKEYFAAHRGFVIATGGLMAAALVLAVLAMSARSAASDAEAEAENLRKLLKSSEGRALSASARQALEAEVGGLKARVEELERVMNPPKEDAGSDPVLTYGARKTALERDLARAASENSVQVPEKTGFGADVDPEDVPALLPVIELAQRVVKAAVACGARRIESVGPPKSAGEFFTEEMATAGPVKRTCVVIEVRGPVEAMVKLLYTLQDRATLYIIPRAQLTREKPEVPEALLRVAVGSVAVSDAKPADAGKETETFIFGR